MAAVTVAGEGWMRSAMDRPCEFEVGAVEIGTWTERVSMLNVDEAAGVSRKMASLGRDEGLRI